MLMADTLEAVGIERGQYLVKVNNRKVLDGVMEAIGLGGDENAGRRLTVLRAIDKLDRLGSAGVRELLGPGRKDESGDFTKGAGLQAPAIDLIDRMLSMDASTQRGRTAFVDLLTDSTDIDVSKSSWESINRKSPAVYSGLDELEAIEQLCRSSGYECDRIIIDTSVVRGLEYYTGPVYEAELTFPVVNDEGQTVRFGSVAGGGRYDGLVGRFREKQEPATGFSIGVSRLLSALQIVKSPLVTGEAQVGPVVVLVMDKDRVGDYQRMVSTLRQAGIKAELYLGSAGMKAQMKYADRRGAPCVVIQGSQEKERGEVQIKDLEEGASRAAGATAASSQEYRSQRLAQVSVPETELVSAVQGILDRRGT